MNFGVYIIALVIFFVAAVLQASFLPYVWAVWGLPNLIFVAFFVFIFFEDKHQYTDGFFLAVLAGFFLDIAWQSYFGVSIIALLIVYFLEKFIWRLLREGPDSYPLFYFVPLFFGSFFAYTILLYGASFFVAAPFSLDMSVIGSALFSAALAVIGFYMYRALLGHKGSDNQLKLL